MSHAQWASVMGLTQSEYDKTFQGLRPLSLLSVSLICDSLDITLEGLLVGELDFDLIRTRYIGQSGRLPERYSVAAFSKRRSIVNFLESLENFRGWEYSEQVRRFFQIDPTALSDLDGSINVLFFRDISAFLRKRGFSDSEFYSIGLFSSVTAADSSFAKVLSTLKTPQAIYEHAFVDLISFHERNHSYKVLELDKTHCKVESKSNQDIARALNVKTLGSRDTCIYRSGVMASTLSLVGLPEAHVHEEACEHNGDASCRFVVQYDHIQKSNLRKLELVH